MKASSRRISLNKRLQTILATIVIATAVLVLLPRLAAVLASVVLTPVVAVEDWLFNSEDTIPAFFRDRNELLDIEQDLRRQLSEQEENTVVLRQLQAENEALRSLFATSTDARIAASVMGRPPQMPYDVVVVDQGRVDGVIESAPVFIGANRVIGYVGEVFEHTAVVVLFTTPDVESTVYIYGPNIYTTAIGVGGGLLRVHVPQGIDLTVGDVAVLPAVDGGIYGEVVSIESVATKPEQYGFVSVDVPISSLRYVSIGTRPIEQVSFADARAVVERVRHDLLAVPVPEEVLVDTHIASSSATTSSSTATTTETL